jgi:hypothetical protein
MQYFILFESGNVLWRIAQNIPKRAKCSAFATRRQLVGPVAIAFGIAWRPMVNFT